MNRFGKIVLAVILLAGIALATAVRFVSPSPPPAPAAPPGPAVLVMLSGLAIPVAGIAPTALTDTFSDPRGAGGGHIHGAIDIPAPPGTPVLAAAPGRVEKLYESRDGGHTVYVRSPDGRFVYYYAHLDGYQPDLREGVTVARGQPIGAVGSTGDANPAAPHLHFEIKRMAAADAWYQGQQINPYPLLAGKPAPG